VRVAPARVQTSSLRVSHPGDPAEKEADTTAKKVMSMSIPDRAIAFVRTAAGGVFRALKGKEKEKEDELARLKREGRTLPPQAARFAAAGLLRKPMKEEEREKLLPGARPKLPPQVARFGEAVRRKAEGLPNVKSNVAAEIQSSRAAGNPLPLSVRRFMEPRFQADFSQVRVHTGEKAAKLNRQLNAKAFAVGNSVFFGKGQFRPETGEGRELIAHELTHTIQQGAAVQRSEDAAAVTQHAPEQVQRLGLSDALDYFADKANLIPGFRMLTIVLGVNPVNMSRVDRSAANILRAVVEFIPGGGLITKALDQYGVFDRVGAWVDQQIRSLGMTGAAFKAAIDQFLDSLSWSDIFDLGGVWSRAKRIFSEPVDQLIRFAGGLLDGILGFIRDAILRPLAGLAEGTRGYPLLKAILGKDPITGDPVPRNAETLIGGFMKLIGQEEVWENIKKGNAIGRAWTWFQESLSGLMSQVRAVPGRFMDAVRSLTLADIVVLPRAFAKVGAVFLDVVGGFFSWAGGQVMKLLEIVFDVVSPGAMGYVKKTGAALLSILKNPLPFVGNLVKAAKTGFLNFAGRFGTHLKAGLIDWLTGSLPGIYIPRAFTLGELVKFVFSALGLTWANVRAKLVKVVGETAVKAMETGFDIVVTLVTQGPAAAWDKIKAALGSLQDMVIGGITDLVVDAVVKKAIPKLIAMFIPGAGFISAILSIYDTVMVFVSKISKIIQVVNSFISSIVAIAAGQIGAAAAKVESVLAGLLTLAINFLAGFAGLGRVSDKIMGVLAKVRAPIDKALDALINWIVTMAKKLFARVFGRDPKDDRTPEKKMADLRAGVSDAQAVLKAKDAKPADVEKKLPGIRAKYRLVSLTLVTDAKSESTGTFHVLGEVNPTLPGDPVVVVLTDWPPGLKAGRSLSITGRKENAKVTADPTADLVSYGWAKQSLVINHRKQFFIQDWNAGKIKFATSDQTADELRADLTRKHGPAVADAVMRRGELAEQIMSSGVGEAHHIIPISVLKKTDILHELVKGGYDFNQAANGIALASAFHTKGQARDHPKYNRYVAGRINKWVEENQGSLTLAQLAPTFAPVLKQLQGELRDLIAAAWAANQAVAKLIEQDIATKGSSTRKAPSLDDAVSGWP
jgi:hypothetical protein